tara:strand:- start:23 stop:520 length:498 start_codon:yes stop_codon:yes gene_type:complete
MMEKNFDKKCKKIKLVLSDIDGVLTDGGMYYSKDGEALKKFHTRDGIGIELLLAKKIKTVLITREISRINSARGKKLKIDKILEGISDKRKELEKICKDYNVKDNEIAYIGDDINDLEIMKCVGFRCTPKDGALEIKKIADYICKLEGGKGVFREMADLIIKYNK